MDASIIFKLVAAILLSSVPTITSADPANCRVGFIAGLSGAGSVYGIAPMNGLQLAVSEVGGGHLNIIVEDDQFTPKLTVAAFQKLKDQDDAQLIFVVGSSMALAVAPLAERATLPLIALASDRRIGVGRTQVLRVFASGEDEGAFMWAEVQRRKYRSVAYVFNTNDYPQAVVAGFKRAAAGGTLSSYFEEILPTEMDTRTHAARIAKKNVDAIGLCLAPGQIGSFARQLKSLGSTAQFFGCVTLDNQAEAKAARGALNGAWFVTSGATGEFRERYRIKFGNEDFIGGAAVMYELGLLLPSLCRGPRDNRHFPKNLLELLVATPTASRATQLIPMMVDGERYLRPPLVVRVVE